jgi:hypothetical protein
MFDAYTAEIDYRQQQITDDWRRASSRQWFRRHPAGLRTRAGRATIRNARPAGAVPADGA